MSFGAPGICERHLQLAATAYLHALNSCDETGQGSPFTQFETEWLRRRPGTRDLGGSVGSERHKVQNRLGSCFSYRSVADDQVGDHEFAHIVGRRDVDRWFVGSIGGWHHGDHVDHE
ncbi:MAG: hypothetical protein EBS22_05195 [Acidimicrobiia bacterium]|nr:hypothetical protein [Acidimicrobiia bacterium]